MTRPLPALDIDLIIEHDGHQAAVTGSGHRFVAKCPTLKSVFHYSLNLWPWRKVLPSGYIFQMEWRGFRFPPRN